MKVMINILTILLLVTTSVSGQNISAKDSLKVVKAYKTLFAAIDSDDKEALGHMSTNKIYCIICSDKPDFSDPPYMFNRNDFSENYLGIIRNNELYQRATKSDEIILLNYNDQKYGITVYWTIYKRDELASGHEGVQFGISFDKVNSEFKFAGIETVP